MLSSNALITRLFRSVLSSTASKPRPTPPTIRPDVLIDEENNPGYDARHFYPVRIGDVFQNRYQIALKLGAGSCSTVWLARDVGRWSWRGQYVTLKINFNNFADQALAEHELEMSRRVTDSNPTHEGYAYVRTLLDSFVASGPDGKHVCLVFQPMREPLWILQKRLKGASFSSNSLKAVLALVLRGLDYLHTECHVIHTDLKADNILVGFENDTVIEDHVRLRKELPSARKSVFDRVIYQSRNDFGHLRPVAGRPKIADFGLAVLGDVSVPHNHPIQPNDLRAPEVVLGAGWSYSADIWNLGALMWDLLEKKSLFTGMRPESQEYTSQAHLAEMIALLGPPPPELLKRGEHTSEYFDSEGNPKGVPLVPSNLTFASAVSTLDGEDKERFIVFAQKMLKWIPENRKTAKELLEDPWLNSFV